MLRRLVPFVAFALLAACRKPATIAVDPTTKDAAAPGIVAKPAEMADAGTASPFSVVTKDVTWRLVRVENGPVLGVDTFSRVVLDLSAEGGPRFLSPVQEVIGERFSTGMQIGRIAGRWPDILVVEGATFAGRGGTVLQEATFDLAKGTSVVKGASGYTASAWTWKNGTVLAFHADDASIIGPFVMGRRGTFLALAGPKPAVLPKRPAKLVSPDGTFIAYPSGRMFVLAGVAAEKSNEDMPDMEHVWSSDGAAWKAEKMPSEPTVLARGRDERETLVAGRTWLRRWDGSTFVDVTLPPKANVSSLSIGDDGSVWLATGEALFRASFPELAFAAVPLPNGSEPREVVARDESDVWLLSGVMDERGGGPWTVLHTQPPRALYTPPSDDESFYPAVFAQKSPSPYTKGCRIPFVVFGAPSEVTDDDARTIAKAVEGTVNGKTVRGATKDGPVVGLAVDRTSGYSDASDEQQLQQALARVRKKRPSAKVLCTRPVVEQEIEAR